MVYLHVPDLQLPVDAADHVGAATDGEKETAPSRQLLAQSTDSPISGVPTGGECVESMPTTSDAAKMPVKVGRRSTAPAGSDQLYLDLLSGGGSGPIPNAEHQPVRVRNVEFRHLGSAAKTCSGGADTVIIPTP